MAGDILSNLLNSDSEWYQSLRTFIADKAGGQNQTQVVTQNDQKSYVDLPMPQPLKLTIPEGGMNNRDAALAIEKNALRANAWRVQASNASVGKERAIAFKSHYEAMSAAIGAGTAFVQAKTGFFNLKEAENRMTIAESAMNLAFASVPVEKARHSLEFEKLKLQLSQTQLEVNKLSDDVKFVKAMNELQGYNTEVLLPQSLLEDVSSILGVQKATA